METHIILCCGVSCKDREMDKECTRISLDNLRLLVSRTNGRIITKNARYIFMICDSSIEEKIAGYHIDSYRTCGNVVLSPEVKQYLDIHLKEGGKYEVNPLQKRK